MIKKWRKPAAWLLLTTMTGMFAQSCTSKQEIVTNEVLQNSNEITIEQRTALDELEVKIDKRLELISLEEATTTHARRSNRIDPSNPNNPYENVGKQLQQILEYAAPRIKDIVTPPPVVHGVIGSSRHQLLGTAYNKKTLVRNAVIDATRRVTGRYVNPNSVPSESYYLNLNLDNELRKSNLSIFGQCIVRYYSNSLKTNSGNPKAIVETSKILENFMNSAWASRYFTQIDKDIVVSAITRTKYLTAFTNNNYGNAQFSFLDDMLDCLGQEALMPVIAIGALHAADGIGEVILVGLLVGCALNESLN